MGEIRVGILALQGCVTPHIPHLLALGASVTLVKKIEDTKDIDGYILPGGESSTMLRLMDHFNLKEHLQKEFKTKPCWGICAGAILLSREVENVKQFSFNLIDYSIKRNAYGRQLDSKEEIVTGYPVCYIRAPIIQNIGNSVEVIAKREGDPVWVIQKNKMATTFHPELTKIYPSPMHQKFIELIKNSK